MAPNGQLADPGETRRRDAEQAARLAAQMIDPDKALPGHIRTRVGQRRIPEQEPAAPTPDAATEPPADTDEGAAGRDSVTIQVSSTRRTRVRRGAGTTG